MTDDDTTPNPETNLEIQSLPPGAGVVVPLGVRPGLLLSFDHEHDEDGKITRLDVHILSFGSTKADNPTAILATLEQTTELVRAAMQEIMSVEIAEFLKGQTDG